MPLLNNFGRNIVIALSVRSHKLVVEWPYLSPFEPYVAKWVKVSSHLNPNSDVYFWAEAS